MIRDYRFRINPPLNWRWLSSVAVQVFVQLTASVGAREMTLRRVVGVRSGSGGVYSRQTSWLSCCWTLVKAALGSLCLSTLLWQPQGSNDPGGCSHSAPSLNHLSEAQRNPLRSSTWSKRRSGPETPCALVYGYRWLVRNCGEV